MENYIKRYLEEYESLGHTWGNASEFEFLKGYPYHALGVISEVHGAAAFFTPDPSQQEIEIITHPERIEFYLFPQMKAWWNNSTTFFRIEEYETVIFDASVWPEPIKISPGGHFEIYGTLIYENRMILKGSNDERLWLPEVAMMDATNDFLRTAKNIVLTEAEVKEVQGIALLRAKYEEIGRNEKDGVYAGNPWLRAKHEEEFWDLAEEYEIRPNTANLIKSQALLIYKEQPIYQPNMSSIVDSLIGSSIFTSILLSLQVLYEKKIKREPKKKRKRSKPKSLNKQRKSSSSASTHRLHLHLSLRGNQSF